MKILRMLERIINKDKWKVIKMKKIRFKDYLIDYLEYNNITNKDFANRLDITPKHLIDILSGDVAISSEIANRIALVTNIPIDYIYKVELNYKFEEEIEEYLKKENFTETAYLNKYNYKYLIKNDYIEFIDAADKLEVIKDILKFLRVPSPEKVKEIDQGAYYKSKNDKPELLLLWLEKCYRETLKQQVAEYQKENIEILVKYICECAKKDKFDKDELIQTFNDNGIFLVVQEDIPGSKIRGAFRVHRGIPAIYLTYKHRRLADIYFALLHELAHCKTNYNRAQSASLVSFEEASDEEEIRADNQAYKWMVEDKYYETLCNEADLEKEKEYPKAFVAYRMAKDNKIKYSSKAYQKYNKVIEY